MNTIFGLRMRTRMNINVWIFEILVKTPVYLVVVKCSLEMIFGTYSLEIIVTLG